MNSSYWTGTLPTYQLQNKFFFEDIDENIGSWHRSKIKYRHSKSCFDATYLTNSHGMKDVERSLNSNDYRVVMLGDSMVEGYGLSNRHTIGSNLESISNKEYLNFGTSGHFGSTQFYLAYKHIASKFTHNEVYVFITPWNDFEDDSYKFGKEYHNLRYRPYHVEKDGKYQLVYHNNAYLKKSQNITKQLLSSYFSTYHIVKHFYKLYKSILYRSNIDAQVELRSGYFDFNEKQFSLLQYNLNLLRSETEKNNSKFKIFLIPTLADYEVAESRSLLKRETPLYLKLKERFPDDFVYDLFVPLTELEKNYKELYLSCDGHFNKYGARLIAKLVNDSDK